MRSPLTRRAARPAAGRLLLTMLLATAGCRTPWLAASPTVRTAGADAAALVDRIDAALRRAGAFLIAKGSDDGAWRSETYGAMRDGPSLTSHVLTSLHFLRSLDARTESAFARGVAYLRSLTLDTPHPPSAGGCSATGLAERDAACQGLTDGDGNLRLAELPYPIYTAAAASWLVTLTDASVDSRRARDAWIEYLRQRRLGSTNGWTPDDPQFGGWGYAVVVPRNPPPGELSAGVFESNISATVYGLGALRFAGAMPDEPAIREILAFVQRCQNFAAGGAPDARFDDGGFFFSPTDASRNKAGAAGADASGRERFNSYGSATADGLRALLQCGLPPDHPRVAAARRWLERNFSAERNPGRFAPDREVLRDAYYYYYGWSLAHAFARLSVRMVETNGGRADWAAELADALLRRQQPDGSWRNRYTDAREDDPLVATPFAVAALLIARDTICRDVDPSTPPRSHAKAGLQ